MAGEVVAAFRVSARRACDLVGCDRGTFYYRARRRDVAPKTYRLYREEGPGVRVKRRKKRASQLRVVPVAPTRPNERWAMDFVADRLDHGRRIRILTIEDVFTRECLAVEVDTSLVSARVVAVLGRLVQARGPRRSFPSTMGPNSTPERRTAGLTGRACASTSAGPASRWTIPSSKASVAASGTSISTPSCSSRWPMPRRSYWSGNGTTMRSGRIAPWGRFPLGSSWPRGS